MVCRLIVLFDTIKLVSAPLDYSDYTAVFQDYFRYRKDDGGGWTGGQRLEFNMRYRAQ